LELGTRSGQIETPAAPLDLCLYHSFNEFASLFTQSGEAESRAWSISLPAFLGCADPDDDADTFDQHEIPWKHDLEAKDIRRRQPGFPFEKKTLAREIGSQFVLKIPEALVTEFDAFKSVVTVDYRHNAFLSLAPIG